MGQGGKGARGGPLSVLRRRNVRDLVLLIVYYLLCIEYESPTRGQSRIILSAIF